MLYMVGLGIYDEEDISIRGMKAIEDADEVILECYTSSWKGRDGLKKIVDKDVEEVERSDLEESSVKILERAVDRDIVILVPGDPLVATTHVEILIQANKMNLETSVIHSSSIYSAVSETGLQIYKFGKTTTIPIPRKNYRPVSPYEVIGENKEQGLHTLALLDITNRPMEVPEALGYLTEIENEKKEGVIDCEQKAVAFSAGPGKSRVVYAKIAEMLDMDFPTPAVLIFPGELHEKEEEALETFSEEIHE